MASINTINIAYMNIHGQTGLDIVKQVQIENFIRNHKIDILNCQEINISADSFENCDLVNSSYSIISNNAINKYGTCCFVSNTLQPENIKFDTSGRVIVFNLGNITFGNVYLPSGNDPVMRNCRENYSAEILPQLLLNCKASGCIGGDWNCITDACDATKNSNQKMSPSLKRLMKNFSWCDSLRTLYPDACIFSRYYEHSRFGDGATRIDRQYWWGNLKVLEIKHVGVAFSDHQAVVAKVKVPEIFTKLLCPGSKPSFKAKPEVVRDSIFNSRLKENFAAWLQIREAGLDTLSWWDLIVKPGTRKLLIERGKELNQERNSLLNLLMLRQCYLVSKLQKGFLSKLPELKLVQAEIQLWHKKECEKIKLQSRSDEVDSHENVRIYHHELHAKHLKRSSILKLSTESGILEGHAACSKYLEKAVGDLLLHPANLDENAQQILLKEVKPVFTSKDNEMFLKPPTKDEVKESLWSAKISAAPGTDGLTNLVYRHCWDIFGDSLTEVAKCIHGGASPTTSQRTSLMVYGAKANKPPSSTDPKHKRRISLLNSDFKIISGIDNNRFKKVSTHTLNPNQLSAGCDRRIHHGINNARDAILSANSRNQGAGILDNDYMSAFDLMVLTWVFKVLEAKGLDKRVITRLKIMYDNHVTIVVVNNIRGQCFPNHRWSIRQGDRPSSILFCYGLDPHLDWLEKRLQGIPMYLDNNMQAETYKLKAYVDDVKPGITSMHEFTVVDQGSAIFEAASGCVLHRDPSSGKVKFLPLGRWRGMLTREDIPVNYIVMSEHLDMIGVKLLSTYQKTRKVNCDEIQDRVKQTIGPWRGGKFMPLISRPHSLNTYCLSKVWFKTSSVNLRMCDLSKISAFVKSWLFADQLEKPEEMVLHRPRTLGGLGLVHIQSKALSLLITSFLESAIMPKFQRNLYHHALYNWHIQDVRTIPAPSTSPYYDAEFFSCIKEVKEEGLLNILTMTSGMWYRVLVEKNVTHEALGNTSRHIPCRAERNHPAVDWDRTWRLASTPGLSSDHLTFLWRMLHNLLPCQARLFRMRMPNITTDTCAHCNQNETGNINHSLLHCNYNDGAGQYLLEKLSSMVPNLHPDQVTLLDLDLAEDDRLPAVFLIAAVLSEVWLLRKDKKPCHLNSIRATLEAGINIMRKSRYKGAANKLSSLIISIE